MRRNLAGCVAVIEQLCVGRHHTVFLGVPSTIQMALLGTFVFYTGRFPVTG